MYIYIYSAVYIPWIAPLVYHNSPPARGGSLDRSSSFSSPSSHCELWISVGTAGPQRALLNLNRELQIVVVTGPQPRVTHVYIYIILFIYYFSIYRIYTFKCYVRNYVRIMSQGGDRLKTIVLIHIYIYVCIYIYTALFQEMGCNND